MNTDRTGAQFPASGVITRRTTKPLSPGKTSAQKSHSGRGTKKVKPTKTTVRESSQHKPASKKKKLSVVKVVSPKKSPAEPASGSSLYCPAIDKDKKGSKFFIPRDLRRRNGILQVPSRATCAEIDRFQKSHLTTAGSDVHNVGVRVREGKSIEDYQVVGIYQGQQIRFRRMTAEEMATVGLANSREDGQNLWMAWNYHNGFAEPCTRLPHFQASNDQIFYNFNGHRVTLGIDAIDSPLPISNINCANEASDANIILLPCIDEAYIHEVNGEHILLKQDIPDDAYRLIAVADRDLSSGEELLLNYTGKGQKACSKDISRQYFCGPENYFYPMVCPANVCVESVDDGLQLTVKAISSGADVGIQKLRKAIERCVAAGKSLSQVAASLHRFVNPLTALTEWNAGDLQYFCELANIRVPDEGYRHLTYLHHCCDRNGKLDNNGRNYLSGFTRTHLPGVKLPATLPDRLPAVVSYLESIIENFKETHASEDRGSEAALATSAKLELVETELEAFKTRLGPCVMEGRPKRKRKAAEPASQRTTEPLESLEVLVVSIKRFKKDVRPAETVREPDYDDNPLPTKKSRKRAADRTYNDPDFEEEFSLPETKKVKRESATEPGSGQYWSSYLNAGKKKLAGLARDSEEYFQAIKALFLGLDKERAAEFRTVQLTSAGIEIPTNGVFRDECTAKWQKAHLNYFFWIAYGHHLPFKVTRSSKVYLNIAKILRCWNDEYKELVRHYLFSLLNVPLTTTSLEMGMPPKVRDIIQSAYSHMKEVHYPPKGEVRALDFHKTWSTDSICEFLKHFGVVLVKETAMTQNYKGYEKILRSTGDPNAYFYYMLNELCSNKFDLSTVVSQASRTGENLGLKKELPFPQIDGLSLPSDCYSLFLASVYAFGFVPTLMVPMAKSRKPHYLEALRCISRPKLHPVLYRNFMILYVKHLKGDTHKDLNLIKFKVKNFVNPSGEAWSIAEIKKLRRESPAPYTAPYVDIWRDKGLPLEVGQSTAEFSNERYPRIKSKRQSVAKSKRARKGRAIGKSETPS